MAIQQKKHVWKSKNKSGRTKGAMWTSHTRRQIVKGKNRYFNFAIFNHYGRLGSRRKTKFLSSSPTCLREQAPMAWNHFCVCSEHLCICVCSYSIDTSVSRKTICRTFELFNAPSCNHILSTSFEITVTWPPCFSKSKWREKASEERSWYC